MRPLPLKAGLCALLLVSCLTMACTGNTRGPVTREQLRAKCEPFNIEPAPDVTPAKRIDDESSFPKLSPQAVRGQAVACVHITISAEGQVVDTDVVYTNNPIFARDYRNSLLELKYEPATRAGKPIESKIMVTGSFTSTRSFGRR